MRRAVLTLGSTVAGLAALLSFKTHSAASSMTAAAAAPSTGSQSSPAAGAGAGDAAGAAPAASPTRQAAKQNTQNTGTQNTGGQGTSGGAGTRTLTGNVENTPYGPTQVAVTLTGQRITGVQVLQQTNDGINSQQIDNMAIPKLKSETLAAQSARIDAVSGASYTSMGYIQSLQSALDKAKA